MSSAGPADDLSLDVDLAGLPVDDDGRPILGRMSLTRRLGRGGMGTVYCALHPRLHVEVAVKVLPKHLIERDPKFVDRFLAEGRLAAAISSDHIVRVLDVDVDRNVYFLVLEYVPGESAGALLRRRHEQGIVGGLTERVALDIVAAATRGLTAAHAKGIVHRDIKPDNILIPEGTFRRAKLGDLGLAKPQGSVLTAGLGSHAVLGTPGFMPPEQIDDPHGAGKPADVFSMGATLYALLCGNAPFAGSSTAAVIRDTTYREPDPLPTNVSLATRNLVSKCLAKKPGERFSDGADLLMAIESPAATAGARTPIPEAAPARRELPGPTPPTQVSMPKAVPLEQEETRLESKPAPAPLPHPPDLRGLMGEIDGLVLAEWGFPMPIAVRATPLPRDVLAARALMRAMFALVICSLLGLVVSLFLKPLFIIAGPILVVAIGTAACMWFGTSYGDVARTRLREFRRYSDQRRELRTRWSTAYRELKYRFDTKRQELRELCKPLAVADETYQRELFVLWMRAHRIENANIPQIGSQRTVSLAIAGVHTADDIKWHVLNQIVGLGPSLVGNLVAWRDQIASQFTVEVARSRFHTEVRALEERIRTGELNVAAKLRAGKRELEAMVAEGERTRASLAPEALAIVQCLAKAEADKSVL